MTSAGVALAVRQSRRLQPTSVPTNDAIQSKSDSLIIPHGFRFDTNIPAVRSSLHRISLKVADLQHNDQLAAEPYWDLGDLTDYDIKKLFGFGKTRPSLGRRSMPKPAVFDPNAADADGDGLVQEGTTQERPATKRPKRKPGRLRRSLANALDNAATANDRRAERRESRRAERKPSKVRSTLANALDSLADRADGKPRRRNNDDSEGVSLPSPKLVVPDKPNETPKPDEAVTPKEPAKPAVEAAEDVAANAIVKRPGKQYGSGTNEPDALFTAKNQSKKGDKEIHVIQTADGKFRVVDGERLDSISDAKKVASFRKGYTVSKNGKKTSPRRPSDKKLKEADGWTGGGLFANTELAVADAQNLKNMVFPGKTFGKDDRVHVVQLDNGMAALVDDAKLAALNIEPYASFRDGQEVLWDGKVNLDTPNTDKVDALPEVKKTAKKKGVGKQFGTAFSKPNTAEKRAAELSKNSDQPFHVIQGDDGKYRIVDQARLNDLNVAAFATFQNGSKPDVTPEMSPADVADATPGTINEPDITPSLNDFPTITKHPDAAAEDALVAAGNVEELKKLRQEWKDWGKANGGNSETLKAKKRLKELDAKITAAENVNTPNEPTTPEVPETPATPQVDGVIQGFESQMSDAVVFGDNYDQSIGNLWDLKNQVDLLSAEYAQQGDSEAAKKLDTLSNQIYGQIEDLEVAKMEDPTVIDAAKTQLDDLNDKINDFRDQVDLIDDWTELSDWELNKYREDFAQLRNEAAQLPDTLGDEVDPLFDRLNELESTFPEITKPKVKPDAKPFKTGTFLDKDNLNPDTKVGDQNLDDALASALSAEAERWDAYWLEKTSGKDLDLTDINDYINKREADGADIGELAALRTNRHNWAVLSGKGEYEHVDDNWDVFDLFNHLGPSARQSVLGKFDELHGEDASKILNPAKGVKKKVKKDVAKEVASIDTGLSPKKLNTPLAKQVENLEKLGIPTHSEMLDKAPDGSVFGVYANADDAKAAALEASQTSDKELMTIAFEGSDAHYLVDAGTFGWFAKGDEATWMDSIPYMFTEGIQDVPPGTLHSMSIVENFKPAEKPTPGLKYSDNHHKLFPDEAAFFAWKTDAVNGFLSEADQQEFDQLKQSGYDVIQENGTGKILLVEHGSYNPAEDDAYKFLTVQNPNKIQDWAPSQTIKIGQKLDGLSHDEQATALREWINNPNLYDPVTLSDKDSGVNHSNALNEDIYLVSTGGNKNDEEAQQFLAEMGEYNKKYTPGWSEPSTFKVQLENGNTAYFLAKPSLAMHLNDHPEIFQNITKNELDDKATELLNTTLPDGPNVDSTDLFTHIATHEGDITPDLSWVNGEPNASSASDIASQWLVKLDIANTAAKADLEISGAQTRLAQMRQELLSILGADEKWADLPKEEIAKRLTDKGIDPDSYTAKMKATMIRLEASKKWRAAQIIGDQEAIEATVNLEQRIADGDITKASQINEIIAETTNDLSNAEQQMSDVLETIANGQGKADALTEYLNARQNVMIAKRVLATQEDVRKKFVDKKYGGKAVITINGEEFLPNVNAIMGGQLNDVEHAINISSAITPLLGNGDKLGVYVDDSGKVFLVNMDKAADANLPTPHTVITSQGPGGLPLVDSTDLMDMMSSPGMPKVKDGYLGTENLGINTVDGKAVGQFVPAGALSPVTNQSLDTADKAVQHLAEGGRIADVPNEFLRDAIWNLTEGGGLPAGETARFKLLSKASGYNDIGVSGKDQTNRFQDVKTGQTFVIKSALRNDQEGVRELFGNYVMQSLGFPSSGGRTAAPKTVAPNKFPSIHPEHDPAAEQIPVLFESAEMLYDGTSLGHITSKSSTEKADIISRLTPESVAAGVVMDSLFRYYDRQNDNWVAIELPDGTVQYHPIDHGNAFGPFKAHKFFNKDGKKGKKNDGSQKAEDDLGFMLSGLDGLGTWKLAKDSMNTPERRQRFAEAVLTTVRRAEGTDYAARAEELITAQNLDGKLADRARTSAKTLDDKKQRLDAYVDPMLKELGMSDEEIAAAREAVANAGTPKGTTGAKPVTMASSTSSSLVSSTPIPGEEMFGNSPIAPNANTVSTAIGKTVLKPGTAHYVALGGNETKGAVRFFQFGEPIKVTQADGSVTDEALHSMSMELSDDAVQKILKMVGGTKKVKKDGEGDPVVAISMNGHHAPLMKYGQPITLPHGLTKTNPDGTETTLTAAELGFSKTGQASGGKTTVVQTVNGDMIIIHSGSGSGNFTLKNQVTVLRKGSPMTPADVHKTMGRLGITERSYTGDDGWKEHAAELLVRTYDGSFLNRDKSMAERLANVAKNYGVTLNDVEPYFDSHGRLRYRLTETAYERVKKEQGWDRMGYLWKGHKSYPNDPSNSVKHVTGGGSISKKEMTLSGFGFQGKGSGASPNDDMNSGGGKGTCLGMTTKLGVKESMWGGENYAIYEPDAMLRDIGWWAANFDSYGLLNPSNQRAIGASNSGAKNVDPIAVSKTKIQEFLPDSVASVDHMRVLLIKEKDMVPVAVQQLKDQGITEVNGVPVEEFVLWKGDTAGIQKRVPSYTGI